MGPALASRAKVGATFAFPMNQLLLRDPDQCQKLNPIGSRILTLVKMRTGVTSAVGTVMLSHTGALNRRGAETKSRLAWSTMMAISASTPLASEEEDSWRLPADLASYLKLQAGKELDKGHKKALKQEAPAPKEQALQPPKFDNDFVDLLDLNIKKQNKPADVTLSSLHESIAAIMGPLGPPGSVWNRCARKALRPTQLPCWGMSRWRYAWWARHCGRPQTGDACCGWRNYMNPGYFTLAATGLKP